MIRVLVLYPRVEGKRFDLDYYKNRHMPLVKERLNPVKVEMDIGISRGDQRTPYLAVSHMIFESIEQLATRYAKAADELNADKLKFTDLDLIFQVSEIVSLEA
jgi:uncharacterized protein (TIGR02118 family)